VTSECPTPEQPVNLEITWQRPSNTRLFSKQLVIFRKNLGFAIPNP